MLVYREPFCFYLGFVLVVAVQITNCVEWVESCGFELTVYRLVLIQERSGYFVKYKKKHEELIQLEKWQRGFFFIHKSSALQRDWNWLKCGECGGRKETGRKLCPQTLPLLYHPLCATLLASTLLFFRFTPLSHIEVLYITLLNSPLLVFIEQRSLNEWIHSSYSTLLFSNLLYSIYFSSLSTRISLKSTVSC